MLGGSGVLPPNIRHHYTLGQMSILCIIAGEIKHHGICDLPIDKIAALAGVCRTTVQTTLYDADELHHHIDVTRRPRPGQKHLANVVKIISPEWLAWIKRGPTAHRPGIGSNLLTRSEIMSPTKSEGRNDGGAKHAEAPQVAMRREPWARSGPRYGGMRR